MLYIPSITDDAKQQFNIVSEAGETVSFNLYYCPRQIGWFYDISYGNFTANGLRLVVSPNTLNQWINIISFGLACSSTDGFDPYYIDDFTSGRISLYLLDAADIQIAFQ